MERTLSPKGQSFKKSLSISIHEPQGEPEGGERELKPTPTVEEVEKVLEKEMEELKKEGK